MNDYNKLYEDELKKEKLDSNDSYRNGRNEKNTKNLFPYNLFILLTLAILVFAIIYTKYLPLKIEFIIMLIAALIGLIGLAVKKKGIKITSGIFILLISGVIFYGHVKINNLIGTDSYVTHTLSLVVMDDSSIKSVEEAKGKSFGKSSDISDLLWSEFEKEKADNLNASDDLKTYDDSVELADNLYFGNIDVMILDEYNRGNILDKYPDFDTETRILGNIEVKEEREIVDAKKTDVVNKPFTVFISGVDTAGSITANSRSDVNVIAVVNPNTKKILLVSIPRDAYIKIPALDGNKDKITHSGLFGVGATMEAFEDYFDIDINYYAKFNFTSVINIIDIIGEVDVYSHYNFSVDGYTYTKGINSMNGEKALRFVRERYTLPNGDMDRGVHQMELIKGVINTVTKPQNILKIGGIIDEIGKNLDTNMSTDEVSSLIAFQLDKNIAWDFDQIQLEGTGKTGKYSYMIPNQNIYVMEPSESSREEIINKINEVYNEE